MLKRLLAQFWCFAAEDDQKAVSVFIDEAAKWLCKRHPVDIDQVRKTLSRTRRRIGEPCDERDAVCWASLPRDDLKMQYILRLCFSPPLISALELFPPDEAFAIVENEGPEEYALKKSILGFLADDRSPLLTLTELDSHTSRAIEVLEREADCLSKTGYARCFLGWRFADCLGLFHLYPTKSIAGAGASIRNDDLYHMYTRWLEGHDYELGDWDFRNYYDEAEGLSFISPEVAKRLEASRPSLMTLKINLIKALRGYLTKGSATGLWDECLDLIAQSVDASDADFLLEMDRLYDGYELVTDELVDVEDGLLSGGLTDMLALISHYESELTVGTYCRTASSLGEVALSHIRRRGLGGPGYFSTVAVVGKQVLDDILSDHTERETAREQFWQQYRQRVINAFQDELYETLLVPRRVKRKLAPQVRRFLEDVWTIADVGLRHSSTIPSISVGGITFRSPEIDVLARKRKGRRIKDVCSFPSPQGLVWEQVAIRFLKDDVVEITAGPVRERRSFAEMGFQDGRVDHSKPDILWKLLQILAEEDGCLRLCDKPNVQGKWITQRHISDLRKRLRSYFGIEEDPFKPYHRVNAYETRFTLVPLR